MLGLFFSVVFPIVNVNAVCLNKYAYSKFDFKSVLSRMTETMKMKNMKMSHWVKKQ